MVRSMQIALEFELKPERSAPNLYVAVVHSEPRCRASSSEFNFAGLKDKFMSEV